MIENLVASLEEDDRQSDVWLSLGKNLRKGETALVNGKSYERRNCFVRSLELNELHGALWSAVGKDMTVDETIVVNGVTLTSIDCLVKALNLHAYPPPWGNLGLRLAKGQTVVINETVYSNIDCFVNAIGAGDGDSAGWIWERLGFVLDDQQTISIYGKAYSKMDCYITAIDRSPRDADLWHRLGVNLVSGQTLLVNSRPITREDCFVQAIHLKNGASAVSWSYLSGCLKEGRKVMVMEKEYSNLDCCLTALSLEPEEPELWWNLSSVLDENQTVTVGGWPMNKVDCLKTTLWLDDTLDYAWCTLGSSLRRGAKATVRDVQCTPKMCFEKAILLNSEHPIPWSHLGCCLASEGVEIELNGRSYSALDCHLTALEKDERSPLSWEALGTYLYTSGQKHIALQRDEKSGRLSVRPVPNSEESAMDAYGCLLQALALDRKCGRLWRKAAQWIPQNCSSIEVDGVRYSPFACLLEAVRLDPNDGYTWIALATHEAAAEGIIGVCEEKSLSKMDCCLEALRCNPRFGFAWGVLADLLADDGGPRSTVNFRGILYGKNACLAKSLELPELRDVLELEDVLAHVYAECMSPLSPESQSRSGSLEVELGSVHTTCAKSIKLGLYLNEGANGRVFRIVNNSEDVAKVGSVMKEWGELAKVLDDVGFHPNIVRTKRIVVDSSRDRMVQVMEAMDDKITGPLPVRECLAVAKDMLKALKFLSEKRVAHGDVKPSNILFKTDQDTQLRCYKLADFDGAVRNSATADDDNMIGPDQGTAEYCSPERLNGFQQWCFAWDVWALGITLHELRFGRLPFPPCSSRYAMTRAIMDGRLQLCPCDDADGAEGARLQNLITLMLTIDPTTRPTASTLLAEFFPPSPGSSISGASHGEESAHERSPSITSQDHDESLAMQEES